MSDITPAGASGPFLCDQTAQHSTVEMPSAARGMPAAWLAGRPPLLPCQTLPSTAGGAQAAPECDRKEHRALVVLKDTGCPGRTSSSPFLQWYLYLISVQSPRNCRDPCHWQPTKAAERGFWALSLTLPEKHMG